MDAGRTDAGRLRRAGPWAAGARLAAVLALSAAVLLPAPAPIRAETPAVRTPSDFESPGVTKDWLEQTPVLPATPEEAEPEFSAVPPGIPEPPSVSAAAAILMDFRTGQVLYAKNAYRPRAPASTTKILTAIVVLENASLSEKVVVSRCAAYTPGSLMPLEEGQEITVGELLWGILLESANNGCVAVAEHIAGSEGAFVNMMNRRAAQLGARNTHFRNSHGISVRNHYTTAYDLALLARHALTIPAFEAIVRTRGASLYVDGDQWELQLRNTNNLLWTFAGADGVKTGTTSAAGKCLVASATRGGRRLLSVVLRSDDRYHDSAVLLEWGFRNFGAVRLAAAGRPFGAVRVKGGVDGKVDLALEDDFWVACPSWATTSLGLELHLFEPVKAPLRQGQVLGVAEATLDDGVVRAVNLVAADDVPAWTPERAFLKALLPVLRLMARWGIG